MGKKEILTLATVLIAVVMFPVTLTGASVALPDIRAAFGGDLAAAQWVVNGYNTTFAGFMLASGALADIVGRRRLFVAGTAVFVVGGLLSAAAPSLLVLDLLRVLAGIGASAAGTSAMAILSASFEGAARARAFSLFGTAIGFGLAFGPSLSSALLSGLGWRSVFWLPAAVGVVALALSPLLPESRAQGRRVDWPGTVTFTGGLLLVIAGFVEGPSLGWAHPVVIGAFALGVALLGAFAVVERRMADPMFDLELLRNRRFLGAALAGAVFVFVLVPLLVYLPSYMTAVLGMTVGEAGVMLLFLTVPILVMPLLVGQLARRVPATALVLGALVVVGLGVVLMAAADESLAVPLLVVGLGVGASTGLVDGVALSSAPVERSGVASGMFGTSRLAFETVGIGIIGSIIASGTGGTLAGPGYPGALQASLWLMAGAVVLVTALFVLVSRRPVAVAVAV
ncbi:MFS transporter [Actinokineospora sp. UTMC 2448]|uniref:MFS transporter n=1 Tax=Actinokineospora sp. UTMC 2448 TaxID=2268449 RepID=UPI0021644DD5|nr:MFS transporter [Actinokineospora sp. UTMC 2448]UVS76387.1 Spectinomycin tetracycline efflux pump [Actinokineospora sp. UTMC 2448]